MVQNEITANKRSYRVAGRIVCPSANEIIHEGDSIHLEPKSMEVLVFLIGKSGTIVSREEIQEKIWADVTVGDDSLTNAIIKIRKAFGDSARQPQVIETISKRGYRLIAPVTAVTGLTPSSSPAGVAGLTSARYWIFAFVLMIGLLGVAMLVLMNLTDKAPIQATNADVARRDATIDKRPFVAIAPFVNIGGNPRHDYLARGIEESITTDLSQLSQLTVMRLRAGRNRDKDSSQYQYVLNGGILRSGDRLRIDTRLADAMTGKILWSHRYDRPFSDLLEIEDEIHATLIKKLAVKVSEAEKANRARGYTGSIDAYDLFLRAQQALLPRDKSSNKSARAFYRKSIEHDPCFARAYAGLALTYAAQYRNRWANDRKEALEHALQLAETALEISPRLPEQHWVIAYVRTQQRRHDLAETSIRNALKLNPNYADAYALLGGIHTYTGNPEKTIPAIRKAMRLRPSAGYLYFVLLGRAYYFLGNCHQAEINLKEALARNSSNIEARLYRVACHIRQENAEDAEWEVEEIKTISPGFAIDSWFSTYPMTAKIQLKTLAKDLRAAGLR